jgi:hypothetical protein
VLRAAEETETTQERIQDWLLLDEGDPGFQLLTGRKCSVIFYIFISAVNIIKIFICLFYKFECVCVGGGGF